MSESSKVHYFDHTLRTATMVNQSLCNQAMYFYPVPPKEAISVENLYLHFKMTIDAAVPAPQRVLEWIGIANERPMWYTDLPSNLKKIDVNMLADANRVIEGRFNLSSLLTKENIGYREYFSDALDGNYTYVVFMLGPAFKELGVGGIMNLCKTDVIYTTKGIR